MLNDDDRRAIQGLFDRLAEAERRSPQRDAEAEALIRSEIDRQPAAPYYLAQTVIVQQQALEEAERRIAELEERARSAPRSGGLLGGLFDGGRDRGDSYARDRRASPWDRAPQQQDYQQGMQRRGGGFLEGAAQTALGVAGGVMIGNMIGSMFGAGSAHAAEPAAPDNSGDSSANDTDSGGDFGDGGGDFDMGGDF